MQKPGLSVMVAGAVILFVFLFSACAAKQPPGPPQALLDEVAAVEKYYAELAPLAPTGEDSAQYNAAMQAVKDAMAQSNYAGAQEKARLARLEATRLGAALAERELEKYHPLPPLTYHYRQQMKLSEEAQAAGKIDEAIATAAEARKQASLALDFQRQCLADADKRLAQIKDEIERLYRPEFEMSQMYWKILAALPALDCERTRAMEDELANRVAQVKADTISVTPTFIVSAPSEFVRIYGDPIMFEEVTPKGLKGQLRRVQVGTRVNFIRSLMVAPDKTYYYVEDPGTGIKGWMAEERVWPERAALRMSSQ